MQDPQNNPAPEGLNPTEPELGLMTLDQALEALGKAEANALEQQDNFLRAKAETDNVRKRASTDLQQARKFALESFAAELLSVMDSLDGALNVKDATVEAYRSGVELTARQLSSVFEKFNITPINPVNEKFDPNRHQAIAALDHAEVAPNTVLTVMQKGFALHERVLRPALVTVSRQPENHS
jgi:molecular chaperone GrpE